MSINAQTAAPSSSLIQQAIEEGRVIELPLCNKEEALRILAESLESARDGDAAVPSIIDSILHYESQSTAYLGYGIACPHARGGNEGEMICAVGWSPDGIEYGNTDGWPVHLLLMYYVPYPARNKYLTELSSLARAIAADEDHHELVNLEDLDEVKERLNTWIAAMEGRIDPEDGRKAASRVASSLLSQVLIPDILEMLEDRRLRDLRIFLSAQPAPEIAELITALDSSDQLLVFRLLPRSLADEVFSLIDYPSQTGLLKNMAQDETRQVLAALSSDDQTALFEELPANVTQRLLTLLSDADRKQVLSQLSYPKDSVGRLMSSGYVSAQENWTIAKTMEHIRAAGSDSETVMTIYVIDDSGALVGELRLRQLILADPALRVSVLMDKNYVALHSIQDREEAVLIFKKYDVYALPVIDSEGVLLGIVTNDDILDVAEEEATEDFHKAGAIRPLSVGYLKTPLIMLYRSRLPWLIALVFVNIFSGAGIAHFEELLGVYMALVFFLPLLIDSGGNAGAQSATLVIRSMALGELSLKDFARVFWREALVASALGLSMSVAVFAVAWWRSGTLIAVVAALAMVSIVILSSMLGMLLPFVLRRFKVDPAVASGPLVTSLADILGVVIYLSIASIILST
ncbi:MAG TPA: magnesium transporter [Candidatus Hydrogenedentes bacterium]|jgi:magnesium transporter|nr:magnesium transporter [Candidatus Hydrogenedentota bacterium]HOD94576.1 magnesium transporter [Candidatus Hydrogenedentota bacterium]HOR51444.1 magnesium transporter [Candidatus Hydrogenedentota bacterium]HPK24001.1 magnesium transporter [Candidatus Hydrogenedentota bacterium]HQB02178.1 magnesium transporter [Candidatus Hydrogenedentota bacterium]